MSELRDKYPLKVLLKIARLSKSTYYDILSRGDKDTKNEDLINNISNIFYKNHKTYVYRRITLELINQGLVVNHKKVKRLMSKLGLYGRTPKRKYKSYTGDHNGTVRNLLLSKIVDTKENTTHYQRCFDTVKCNQVWCTDVTQFSISSGKLFLSPIIDFHNREVISYDISLSPNFN